MADVIDRTVARGRECRHRYVSLIVRRPCVVFWAFLLTALTICTVIVLKNLIEFTTYGEVELYVESHRYIRQNEMLVSARRQSNVEHKANATKQVSNMNIVLFFEWLDNGERDLFSSAAALQQACEVENLLLGVSEYDRICPIDHGLGGTSQSSATGQVCAAHAISPVSIFYSPPEGALSALPGAPTKMWETGRHTRNCSLLDGGYVAARAAQLHASSRVPGGESLAAALRLMMESGGYEAKHTTVMRSILTFRAPVGAREGDSRPEWRVMEDTILTMEAAFKDHFGMRESFGRSAWRRRAETADLNVVWSHGPTNGADITACLNSDLTYLLFSIGFVLIVMCVHMHSPLLACMGMVQIIVSIPISVFVYRVMLGIPYWGQLSGFSAFVVLGVGADDLFVFLDAYKLFALSATTAHETLEATLVRSAVSIFCTSLTTCFAFLTLAACPLVPIASFGIFSAICIFVDYVLTLTMWPPIVIIWQRWRVEAQHCPCLSSSATEGTQQESDTPGSDRRSREVKASALHGWLRMWLGSALAFSLPGRGRWAKPFSWGLIVSLLTVTGLCAWQASLLAFPPELEANLPPDHMTESITRGLMARFLSVDDSYAYGYVAFGMADLDRSNFSRWLPDSNRGEVIWEHGFDLSDAAQQQAIARVVSAVRAATGLVHPTSVECFLEAWSAQRNGSLPTGQAFAPELVAWLEGPEAEAIGTAGLKGGTLRFALIAFTTTFVPPPVGLTSAKEMRAIGREWEALLEEALDDAPAPLRSGFAVVLNGAASPIIGIQMMFPEFERYMLQGLVASILLSSLVVGLVTRSVRLSLSATLSVACIVACLLGVAKLSGFVLGLAEMVSASLVIGFSVDYTLHLGVTYAESDAPRREERTRDAAGVMGPTVLGSATTTCGAALPMFFCQLMLLQRMGALILGTVCGSAIFSLLLFLPLNSLFGPDGCGPVPDTDTGDRPTRTRRRSDALNDAATMSLRADQQERSAPVKA